MERLFAEIWDREWEYDVLKYKSPLGDGGTRTITSSCSDGIRKLYTLAVF